MSTSSSPLSNFRSPHSRVGKITSYLGIPTCLARYDPIAIYRVAPGQHSHLLCHLHSPLVHHDQPASAVHFAFQEQMHLYIEQLSRLNII